MLRRTGYGGGGGGGLAALRRTGEGPECVHM